MAAAVAVGCDLSTTSVIRKETSNSFILTFILAKAVSYTHLTLPTTPYV